jgi:hypothetical protein
MPWTLENELCDILSIKSIPAALAVAGIIESQDQFEGLSCISDWHRSGAETHLYIFDVLSNTNSRRIVLKACTPTAPTSRSIDQILNEWIARRNLTASHGISVPKLYGRGKGILLEEYIPYTLQEVLSETNNMSAVVDAASLLGTLSRLGFEPISTLTDLRSRGTDAVLVDFGSDLGQPSSRRPSTEREFADISALNRVFRGGTLNLASAIETAYRGALAARSDSKLN